MDCAPPNEFGINTKTEEEPGRNLYMMAWQEFEDVSYDAMAILCERSDAFADRVATRLQEGTRTGDEPQSPQSDHNIGSACGDCDHGHAMDYIYFKIDYKVPYEVEAVRTIADSLAQAVRATGQMR